MRKVLGPAFVVIFFLAVFSIPTLAASPKVTTTIVSKVTGTTAILATTSISQSRADALFVPVSARHLPPMSSTSDQDHSPSDTTIVPTPPGLASCFEYYKFGSTPVSLSSSLSEVAQGSTLRVTGTITNQNAYPILDATVYIKVFKVRSTNKDVNGPDVIDWFPAIEHLNLKADEVLPLTFNWQVPQGAQPGAYSIASYVAASNRFNMYGLTFTDDVVGSVYNFKVAGTDSGATRFEKDSVSVNGLPFYFAAYPPTIPAGAKDLSVMAKIQNTTKAGSHGTLVWQLYYWDSLQQSHLLDTQTQEVKVQPGAETEIRYDAKDTSHSVYYLVGTLTEGDSKSIVGIRFVREGNPYARLNFVGVNAQPGQKDSVAVACIHSTSSTLVEDGRVELTAHKTGLAGLFFGSLGSATYKGIIPGDINALTIPLTKPASSFVVTATLYQGNKIVDQVTESYGCSLWAGNSCNNNDVWWAIGVLVLILIMAAIVIYRRRRNSPPVFQSNTLLP
jgi:hypothetical protein